jgi:RHS repeat-associated protein
MPRQHRWPRRGFLRLPFADVEDALLGRTYSAWGDRYRFTVRKSDSNEALLYNRARHYDPTPGRWLNEEPVGFDSGDEHTYPYPSP